MARADARGRGYNRATIIATAQLTAELDDTRLTINHKGVQREIATFVGGLAHQGAAQTALLALRNTHCRGPGAQAKKAVACLLYILPGGWGHLRSGARGKGRAHDGRVGPGQHRSQTTRLASTYVPSMTVRNFRSVDGSAVNVTPPSVLIDAAPLGYGLVSFATMP